MPITADLMPMYGSAGMQDTDSGSVGGAISTTKMVTFSDMGATGNIQIVSSSSSDTTPTVQTFGRDGAGALINETKTLNGQSVVPMTANLSWERLLKSLKGGATVGDIAVESVTAVRSATAQAGGAQQITLDASASAVDNFYNNMVIRIVSGLGSGQVRRCTWTDQAVAYNGTTKVAYVDRAWVTPPDNTSVFKISYGFVFPKLPSEVLEIRRLFYNVDADAPGGASKTYYEKVFIKNLHGSLALTTAQIVEQADPSSNGTFGVASTLDDSGTATDRRTAPGGITFNSATKNVANSGVHTAGAAQGIWLALTLPAGSPPSKTSYTVRETGFSV